MRKHIPGGIWELFIPELPVGSLYKFSVKQRGGRVVEKIDPYGFAAEVPPKTANIVADLDQYDWNDQKWMATREKFNALDAPISIYEVHLGSWRRNHDGDSHWLNYRELAASTGRVLPPDGLYPSAIDADQRTSVHRQLGLSDRWLLRRDQPLRFAGRLQVLCRPLPSERHWSLDRLGAGPFPEGRSRARLLRRHALFEHADPRQGEHPDWGTKIFNYGRNEVRNFLTANALFWLDKYHIDGLRVDAVASMLYLDYSREEGDWIPNQYGGRENLEAISFLKEFNEQVHLQFPGTLTVAEESTAWGGVSRPTYLGGLGFSLKWNMGWMNDTLRYMRHEPIHRGYHHDELTFSLIYAFTENFTLPFSHDEVVHGKGSMLDQMPGDLWQQFANLRLLYGYQWTHPGKKLQFMGGEIAQWNEWDCENELQWDLLQWELHQGMQKLVSDLNTLYRREPALHQVDFEYQGFDWVDSHNYNDSVLVYMRKATDPNDFVFVACNFTPVVRKNYRLGVPEGGWYDEVFNTDSQFYGGSNVGNFPGVEAEACESHSRPYSIELTLPPLAVVVLKPRRES